ncbi:MAG: DUF5752 family protein [Acidobacteriota bacterium]
MQPIDSAQEIKSNHKPFTFKKTNFLVEVIGLKARNLDEFLKSVSVVDRSSIYFHLHQPMLISPATQLEYPNDFAYWMAKVVGDNVLAERLANLEVFRYQDLELIRREIVSLVSQRLLAEPISRNVPDGREFVFCRMRSVVLECGLRANNLREFRDLLGKVEVSSIYHHLVEAKIRLRRGANDFTNWLKAIDKEELAVQVDSFDPYLTTLEGNRRRLLKLLDTHLSAS